MLAGIPSKSNNGKMKRCRGGDSNGCSKCCNIIMHLHILETFLSWNVQYYCSKNNNQFSYYSGCISIEINIVQIFYL